MTEKNPNKPRYINVLSPRERGTAASDEIKQSADHALGVIAILRQAFQQNGIDLTQQSESESDRLIENIIFVDELLAVLSTHFALDKTSAVQWIDDYPSGIKGVSMGSDSEGNVGLRTVIVNHNGESSSNPLTKGGVTENPTYVQENREYLNKFDSRTRQQILRDVQATIQLSSS